MLNKRNAMSYQDIQDYADSLADARLGTSSFDAAMHDIHRAKPSPSELAAIKMLADAYYLSAMGHEVDWDYIEDKMRGFGVL